MVTPKDLRIPFIWKNRQVLIQDGVWFAPSCDVPFTFLGWNHPGLFAKEQPVYVEYCSGNGSWLIEKAKESPHINWLAVEKRFERAKRIWSKSKNYNLDNVAVVWGEGLSLTQKFLKPNSVAKVYVNFPDPWPKRRHAKNRIISKPFVDELARIVEPNGLVTLVTDDAHYSGIMIHEMLANSTFKSQIEPPHFVTAPETYGTSFFDELFRGLNRTIRLHAFSKVQLDA